MQNAVAPPKPEDSKQESASPNIASLPTSSQPGKPWQKPLMIIGILILVVAMAIVIWRFLHPELQTKNSAAITSQQKQKPSEPSASAGTTQGLQLDSNKNYGNKYAGGMLPVGDGKYVTDGAKQGYVYTCSTYAQNLKTDSGGASVRGPWFKNNNTLYSINEKSHVQGSVTWQADFSNKVSGDARMIITNDLPTHTTGKFPIASTDPAYSYDRNPNSIKSQSLTYTLSANPTYSSPSCMGGEVGIMLTGIALFNGFDAGGRDAGAWEIQDGCSGHPQSSGEYHYHTLSSCIKDVSVKTIIGFALDGFPITGPQVGANNILTTGDLDECHGLTSQIVLDGKTVTMYHYVMTQDFPYSVSCFRGKAIQPPSMQSDSAPNTQEQAPLPIKKPPLPY
jgi:hypothetical protein